MALDKPTEPAIGTALADAAATNADDDRRTIARLADELLPTLIARLGASGLGELEVRQDGWRVRLRRSSNGANGTAASSTQGSGARQGSGAKPAGRATATERRVDKPATGEPAAETGRRRERGRVAITSPAVGYYQPLLGLAAGATVRGGDLLGHVDVLGVRQDVVAPEDGTVTALSAQAGEAVEYGQPLARLEPEGGR